MMRPLEVVRRVFHRGNIWGRVLLAVALLLEVVIITAFIRSDSPLPHFYSWGSATAGAYVTGLLILRATGGDVWKARTSTRRFISAYAIAGFWLLTSHVYSIYQDEGFWTAFDRLAVTMAIPVTSGLVLGLAFLLAAQESSSKA